MKIYTMLMLLLSVSLLLVSCSKEVPTESTEQELDQEMDDVAELEQLLEDDLSNLEEFDNVDFE